MKLGLVALASLASLASFAALAACASPAAPTGCDGVPIDPEKELVIVEPSIVGSARASNAADGAMSFRRAAEGQGDAQAFARSLVSAYAEAAPERADAFFTKVVCPWIAATPGNVCDATCASCKDAPRDLAKAPLRLAAVANRVDLGDQPDALSKAGEGRLVFVVTDGPADDPASRELPMTVIVEYALDGDPGDPGERAAWTRDFHDLSRYEAFTDAYGDELASLVSRFSRVAQVRIDDAAFGDGQRFAELALTDADAPGVLRARGLRNTPDPSVDADVLARLVTSDESAVLASTWVLPVGYRATTIDGAHTWTLPGVDADAAQAFTLGTCNGCHAEGARGFQIVPGAAGAARLSPFLAPSGEEMRRRETSAAATLCAPSP